MTAPQPDTTTHRAAENVAVSQQGFFGSPAMARIAPFAAYMAFLAIADLLARLGFTAEQMLWLYPVKIAVVTALLLVYRRSYIELRGTGLPLSTLLWSIAVGIVVLVLWINLDADWMQIGAAAGYDPTGPDGRIDWVLAACRIAGAALVVPVMEELFWRSFLQRWLEKPAFLQCAPAAVGIKALAITAVLFGFEHSLWFAGIVAGIAYGVLYIRTGNLWAPVIAHSVTNGLLGAWVLATGSWAYW